MSFLGATGWAACLFADVVWDLRLTTLALVGALLLGAVAVALTARWRKRTSAELSASDQLAEFRSLYLEGAISKEEFERLKAVLADEMRKELHVPSPKQAPVIPAPETPKPSPRPTKIHPPKALSPKGRERGGRVRKNSGGTCRRCVESGRRRRPRTARPIPNNVLKRRPPALGPACTKETEWRRKTRARGDGRASPRAAPDGTETPTAPSAARASATSGRSSRGRATCTSAASASSSASRSSTRRSANAAARARRSTTCRRRAPSRRSSTSTSPARTGPSSPSPSPCKTTTNGSA